MIQGLPHRDPYQAVTIYEKMEAVRAQFHDTQGRLGELLMLVLVISIGGLAVGGALYLLALGKRWNATRLLVTRVRRLGLAEDEAQLLQRIARAAPPARIAVLADVRGAFDVAAATFIEKIRRPATRLQELSQVLSLRRRLPFEHRSRGRAEFSVGQCVIVRAAASGRRLASLKGYVLSARPQALQIGVLGDPQALPKLAAGRRVLLYVWRGTHFEQCLVRVRGSCVGRSYQLLVDRPRSLQATRIQVELEPIREAAEVELLERFPERLQSDAIPIADGLVAATCRYGISVLLPPPRLRIGESVRIISGAYQGLYRNYVSLGQVGRSKLYFLLPQADQKTAEEPAAMDESAPAAREGGT